MFIHGLSKHPLYKLRDYIIRRCSDPNNKSYKWYGAKGIEVCPQWKNDFISFYSWCINNGWEKGLHLDRIDSSGNYIPANCHFVNASFNTSKRQKEKPVNHSGANNPNSKLTINDVLMLKSDINNNYSTKELSNKYGISCTQVYRIKNGIRWNLYSAL